MKQTTLGQRTLDVISLTKPRISVLTLVTTFTGMFMAGMTVPAGTTLLLTLFGTALGVTSSCMLNNYIDRHLDRHMSRTENRPLPARRLPPTPVLESGILLGVLGVLLVSLVQVLAGALLAISIVNYAVIYSLWMKRSSPYSTELVGFSGALAPVIGWTAVTGRVELTAVSLMTILFFWQPAHFWTLGILYLDDYRKAKLPRYPVVHGREKTRNRMVAYNVLLLFASLSLLAMPSLGWFYGIVISVAGGLYLYGTITYDPASEKRGGHLFLFFSSIGYLLTLLLGIHLDLTVF